MARKEVEHQRSHVHLILERRGAREVLGGDEPADVEDGVGVGAHLVDRDVELLGTREVGQEDPEQRFALECRRFRRRGEPIGRARASRVR